MDAKIHELPESDENEQTACAAAHADHALARPQNNTNRYEMLAYTWHYRPFGSPHLPAFRADGNYRCFRQMRHLRHHGIFGQQFAFRLFSCHTYTFGTRSVAGAPGDKRYRTHMRRHGRCLLGCGWWILV